MSDLTAQIARAMFASNAGPGWGGVSKSVREIYIRAADTVIAHLTAAGRLIPAGGMALTAEQWAHYQRMAADPRFAELSRNALGVVKWPANALLAPAEKPRTHTPPQHNPVTGTTRFTVQRACNRCGRDLGDATEKELDACVNGTPLPDAHDECGCDAPPVVPAPNETGPWDDIEQAPKYLTLRDRDGDTWTHDGDNWITPETAILTTAYINRKYAPFVADEEGW
ncbi:hypothetical protein [Rhodococcus qingshengii]|uniref:hypothetical protein n=1 Tax=Rhodococcus qingshengii TaxID=334542 RepID=UPI001ADF6F4B|nr:hypothetical protein [Rhodococcus qingshengii]